MKQQARPTKLQPVPFTQLPAMGGLIAKPGDVALTEIFKDHPGAGADYPAMTAGNRWILDDDIILPGAADGGLSLGEQKQPLPGSLSRQKRIKWGPFTFWGPLKLYSSKPWNNKYPQDRSPGPPPAPQGVPPRFGP